MSLTLLQTIDERLNCDSVETAPHRSAEGHVLVACGMYELVQGGDEAASKRVGGVTLYALRDNALFETARVGALAGVFDMKWKPVTEGDPCLATACADGTVTLLDGCLKTTASISWTDSFCLANDWWRQSMRVAASSSEGKLCVLDVETGSVLSEWSGHFYPHDKSPAETWTIGCSTLNEWLVASGADEGGLKVWDTRQTTVPSFRRMEAHEGNGVCSVQFDRVSEHHLLSGGYDNKVRYWDLRNTKCAVVTSDDLGGGIWRIKQSENHEKVFVASMRGGFKILAKDSLGEEAVFTEVDSGPWEALAYGADWLMDDVLAGCSFYDKRLRLFQHRKSMTT